MERLNVGLIGSGFMGRSHALALRMAPATFPLALSPNLEILADITTDQANQAAARFGFRRSTDDWLELVTDPLVDLVDITAPNHLHEAMALAAIEAGKIVYCEKPLAPNAEVSRRLTEAAEARGTKTQVGFNYLKNPVVKLAKDMIDGGELGEITGFRGIHAEDYMSDPDQPWSWRLDPKGGGGVTADLGSHIISMARFLLGSIQSVSAKTRTVHASRPVSSGSTERRPVEVEDEAKALLTFSSGVLGSLEASWVATGRTMFLAFEVYGTKGALAFNQERLNELSFYPAGQPAGRSGPVTIVAGPEHAHYAGFCPAPGHQLGFNDLKTIEVREMVDALATGQNPWPDFREAYEVQKVVDAILASSRERAWVDLGWYAP
ncbi:MAG: Gfo/Idh/MocA family protein [Geminicoccaceae bacterium]